MKVSDRVRVRIRVRVRVRVSVRDRIRVRVGLVAHSSAAANIVCTRVVGLGLG